MLYFPQLKFFLGSSSPEGFYSLFDELYNPNEDYKMYIIKGGAGTGKSFLMKKLADIIEKEGYICEKVPCASDPDSLDALIFPELKAAIADGTSPHLIEPKFPGAVEQMINLGDYWDIKKLREHSKEIKRLILANSDEHRRCIQFLSAVKAIDNNSFRTIKKCIYTDKIENYARRLAGREFTEKKGEKRGKGKEKLRFLSAITPKGPYMLYETLPLLCDKYFAIKDEYGLCSSILLHFLKDQAKDKGYDVIACYCPSRPKEKLEHLFIPELGLGFLTENSYHSSYSANAKKIYTRRFLDNVKLAESSCRLRFNAKARRDLIDEAVARLELANSIHDKLESYYIEAMDFKKTENLPQKIAEDILNN